MRIEPVVPGTHPELAALEAQILAERGRISPLYQVLLNSPALTQGWEPMLSAIRNRNSLPPGLRELVILRVAVLNRANYEFEAHVPHALKAGLSQAKIDAVRASALSAAAPWSVLEAVVLRLTDAMTRDIEVSDSLFAEVRQHFAVREQLDLVATVAAYNMVSRLLVALQLGH